MEKIELSRAEIDALDKHNARMREETVREVFSEVKEMLEMAKKLEAIREGMAQGYVGEQKHKYAHILCTSLLSDIEKMERRIIDEEK